MLSIISLCTHAAWICMLLQLCCLGANCWSSGRAAGRNSQAQAALKNEAGGMLKRMAMELYDQPNQYPNKKLVAGLRKQKLLWVFGLSWLLVTRECRDWV